MSISGNLRTMEFADLLQWLAQGSKTGTLVIHDGQVEKRIFFEKGTIISTASSNPKEYLGQFLLSHGLIDEVMLAKAMEMQEENKVLLGKILATIGAISEEDLEHMLRLKAEESLYDIFTWPQGEFRFHDDELPEETMVPLNLNVTALVLEGAKRLDDWRRIRERIPSEQAVPVAIGELEAEAEDRVAQRILSLVDDDRTVEEIALHAHTGEYTVCRALFEQIEAGRLKVVRPRTVGGGEPPKGDVEAEALLAVAQDLLQTGEYERGLRRLRAALSLEPDSRKMQSAVADAERRIAERLEGEGVRLDAVPRLERSLEELTDVEIDPQQGFILTRINDSYDVQTILKISPMPQIDGWVVFWRLLKAGHISLEEP